MGQRGMAFDAQTFDSILSPSSLNDDARRIVRNVINREYDFKEHASMIGDAERTIVGLLWHENIVDVLAQIGSRRGIPTYLGILRCMCLGDYIDRNTFQKQVWQFNELSSAIKTMIGHNFYHDAMAEYRESDAGLQTAVTTEYDPREVRFTRVLTKYSSEFNNLTFIQTLCQKLGVERADLEHLFGGILEQCNGSAADGAAVLDNYDITKQEVERMFKMLVYEADVKKTKRGKRRRARGASGANGDDDDCEDILQKELMMCAKSDEDDMC